MIRRLPHAAGTIWLLAACLSGAAQAARVERLTRVPRSFSGPARTALPGDYLLANGVLEAVISDLPHAGGYAETGGNVLDLASTVNHQDALGEVYVYLQGDFMRQALYTRLATSPPRLDADSAWIEVEGHDARDADMVFCTRYTLAGREPWLRLTTTVWNRGDSTRTAYRVGDVVQWGPSDHFAPGPGHALTGKTLRTPWLAATGEQVAYGYAAADSIGARNGATWSNVTLALTRLAPGDSVTVQRRLFVAPHGDVEAARAAMLAADSRRARVVCRVVADSGASARGAGTPCLVEVRDHTGALVTEARLSTVGRDSVSFELAPGEYSLAASAPAHPAAVPLVIALGAGDRRSARLVLPRTGHLTLRALESIARQPLPAKFTFTPVDSTTPVPNFGPVTHAAGAAHVIFTADGRAETDILPGHYIVTASRGPEYTVWADTLRIEAGRGGHAEFFLRRVLDTAGYIGADFHEHTIRSHDSSLPLEDRIITNLAEGVEVAVATDHDVITDYAPEIARLHATRLLTPVIGDEISTERLGHFIAFPLKPDPAARGHGALQWRGLTPGQIFSALHGLPTHPIVQVNHPRDGRLGYFTQVGLDSLTGAARSDSMDLRFDALEVFNGKRVPAAELVMADWFHLLNRGYTMTATGNSDSHQAVAQEAGYPRNFVRLGVDDPAAVRIDSLVAAVRRHAIVVSNGPMIRFAASDGTPMGGSTRLPSGGAPLTLDVRVDAAPWVDVSSVTLVANGVAVDSAAVAPSQDERRALLHFAIAPAVDTWYVVVVRGTHGLDPVVPVENGRVVTPFAFTNPIWVDADGDGRFTAPWSGR